MILSLSKKRFKGREYESLKALFGAHVSKEIAESKTSDTKWND